jgi:Cof subfamily protein (haloacid dehalogenase superfamily)
MSAQPRLVATDLDGTLVPHGGGLSPYTADVLARLDRRGVPVVFVTARPLRWMLDLWPHVGRHGLAVVSNGAIVYDVHARAVREMNGIDPVPGVELVAAIADAVPGATFAIECVDGIRLDPDFVDHYRVPDGTPRGPLAEIWDVPAVKLLVRHEQLDPTEFRDRVVVAVGDLATPTWSVEGLVEISATGVTKASALARLCADLGIQAADVIAFGDMPNDLPMLAWAGTSYAVADGHPTVTEAADHVAPGPGRDGVARVLAGVFDL